MWLVGVGGIYNLGVATGCGCKEVYRFTQPYSCSFLQQHPYFLFILKIFFVLVPVLFCIITTFYVLFFY